VPFRHDNTLKATGDRRLTPPDRVTRSRLAGETETAIRRHLREHPDWTAAQIWDAVGRDTTSLRTVERRYAAFHGEPDEPWTLLDSADDPEGAALILPLLRHGQIQRGDAEYIARLRRVCPTLGDSPRELELIWYVSRALRRHTELGAERARAGGLPPMSAFSTLLAYAPWEDEGARLGAAVARGDVPFAIAFLGGYEDAVPAERLKVLIEEGLA
jgi:hypothetical protein